MNKEYKKLDEIEPCLQPIDVHVKNIRRKLGDTGRHGRFLETIHGIGYRFVALGEVGP